MTDENTSTETAPSTEMSAIADTEQAQTAADEFKDADREKLTEVVRKERAAAKAAKASAEQAESRLAEMEANELRRTVADDKGLSGEQAAFLTGSTAEEMAASADALLAAFPSGNAIRRSPFEQVRTGATGETEPAESMALVAGKVLE
jgi:hypothetical protein